jgi:hypothetical protein
MLSNMPELQKRFTKYGSEYLVKRKSPKRLIIYHPPPIYHHPANPYKHRHPNRLVVEW